MPWITVDGYHYIRSFHSLRQMMNCLLKGNIFAAFCMQLGGLFAGARVTVRCRD